MEKYRVSKKETDDLDILSVSFFLNINYFTAAYLSYIKKHIYLKILFIVPLLFFTTFTTEAKPFPTPSCLVE